MGAAKRLEIADIGLFADCTRTQLKRIRSLTTYLQLPKDRVLMREGSTAHEFIIIDSGTALVSRQTDQGVTDGRECGQR